MATEIALSNGKRKSSRVDRACLNCRKRKQGCDQERPCKRCTEKNIECVEAPTKRGKKGRSNASHLYDDDDSVQFLDEENDSEEIEFMEDDDIPVVKKKLNSNGSNSSSKDVESQRARSDSGSSDLSPVASPSVTENASTALGSLTITEPCEKHCCSEDAGTTKDAPGLNLSLLFPFLGTVAKATCCNFEKVLAEHQGFPYLDSFPFKTFDVANCDASASPIFSFLHKLKCQFLQEVRNDSELRVQLLEIKRHWAEVMATAQGGHFNSIQKRMFMMEEFFPSLFGEINPGILAWVEGGRIMYANSTMRTWLEYDPEEIKGLAMKDGMGTEYLHLHQVLHPLSAMHLLSKQLSAFMNPEQQACYSTTTVLRRKSCSPVEVHCIVLNLMEPLQRNIGISIGMFLLNP